MDEVSLIERITGRLPTSEPSERIEELMDRADWALAERGGEGGEHCSAAPREAERGLVGSVGEATGTRVGCIGKVLQRRRHAG